MQRCSIASRRASPGSTGPCRFSRRAVGVWCVATGGRRDAREVLEATLAREVTPQLTAAELAPLVAAPAGSSSPAATRTRLPFVISAAGRTPDQLAASINNTLAAEAHALVSGVQPELYAAVRKLVPGVQYHARAKMLLAKSASPEASARQRLPGTVAVVSAGPADLEAADAARLASDHMGCYAFAIGDLSVSNMGRLLELAPTLQAADVVIAIAGVDPCLPAVLAGMVDAPVIAVPTSTGAAAPLGGVGALVGAAANAAAPGVTMVGVDGGAAAGAVAARILAMASARVQKLAAAHASAHTAATVAVAP